MNRLLGIVLDVEYLFTCVHKEEDADTKQVYFYLFKVSWTYAASSQVFHFLTQKAVSLPLMHVWPHLVRGFFPSSVMLWCGLNIVVPTVYRTLFQKTSRWFRSWLWVPFINCACDHLQASPSSLTHGEKSIDVHADWSAYIGSERPLVDVSKKICSSSQ